MDSISGLEFLLPGVRSHEITQQQSFDIT